MGKEITILAFSLMICLCSCEKGKTEMRKELMGSKRITLTEYQKLDRKQKVEIFNQLEMSNRFELLKTILVNSGAECSIGPDGGADFMTDGKLYINLPEGRYLNRWKIDSKGLTIHNDNAKKLKRLEDYLGKTYTIYNVAYWEEFSPGSNRYSLIFESEKTAEEGSAGYSMLGCDP
ncbi:hypothetical protein FH581_000585 [Leptospira weilii]|uniref:hypothetical protein n=1 Tax=Leptospira weilii TaxID=28184 RepID=UPI00201B4B03|nr:hypothetical protein [Leptospira weilii]UPY77366.1 hypothetical protein FH581_000485 [Leptospira weilii]UPY77386.1 hypothetical protein FH581_000585 [Leptospira weilii]